MGWRFWKRDEPEATVKDVDVVVLDRPGSTTAGSAFPVRNEGEAVRVGEAVHLATTFTYQLTTIRRIIVNGVDSGVLEPDQLGDVVLGDEVDLTPVCRSSSLVAAEAEQGGWPDGSFVMQVVRAEPRGDDALVVGTVAVGTTLKAGVRLLCSASPLEDPPPYPKLLMVENVGGELGLVLEGVRADRFLPGDEVIHVAKR